MATLTNGPVWTGKDWLFALLRAPLPPACQQVMRVPVSTVGGILPKGRNKTDNGLMAPSSPRPTHKTRSPPLAKMGEAAVRSHGQRGMP